MENVTLTTGEQGTIYGTLALAKQYIATRYGETYAAWRALNANDDDRKRTLVTAKSYIDSQVWVDAYDLDTERDALQAFKDASYELAVMILADSSLVAAADQGSNIQSLSAGSASVTYFNPTTQTADKLPPILMRLIGKHLAASTIVTVKAGGQAGSDTNPFSHCSDYDPKEPW